VFLGPPRNFNLFRLTPLQVTTFATAKRESGVKVYAHAPYVLHAFSKPENVKKNNGALSKAFKLAANLGLDGYVLHMGGTKSYHWDTASSAEPNSRSAIDALTDLATTIGPEVLDRCPMLLENCASGNALSGNLAVITALVGSLPFNVGICLDTLHAWSWGQQLDYGTPWTNTLMEHVRLVHLNSGPNGFAFGCKRDRHEELTSGSLPISHFVQLLMAHPELPIIVERSNVGGLGRDMAVVGTVDRLAATGHTAMDIVRFINDQPALRRPLLEHPIDPFTEEQESEV
jgi:deoxyribonuclease-4